jgi:hypothetical protein
MALKLLKTGTYRLPHSEHEICMKSRLMLLQFKSIGAAAPCFTEEIMIITKYKTIVGATTVELDRAVNELLQEGYTLYGNPYTNGDAANGYVLCQALVVNESPDPDAKVEVEAESIQPK